MVRWKILVEVHEGIFSGLVYNIQNAYKLKNKSFEDFLAMDPKKLQ